MLTPAPEGALETPPPRGPDIRRPGPELSVVVPTLNERGNVEALYRQVSEALTGVDWEIIFVDDNSPDGTAHHVRQLARHDGRVRCLHRIDRKGLASACLEGMLSSTADYLAVMDADLQHEPRLLPQMLQHLKTDGVELVIGSRYAPGGAVGEWSGSRLFTSRLATLAGRVVVHTDVSDPMSGFFMLRRDLLGEVAGNTSGIGFKILLDILAAAGRPIAVREVPFTFRSRQSGDSKLDGRVVWSYAMLLADKSVGRYVPIRFAAFSLVGMLGVAVHFLVLVLLYGTGRLGFVASQATATGAAMVFNYWLNNLFTYRDRRRHGMRWLTGLFSFALVCALGAAANVGIAALLFRRASGWIAAAIGGIAVGAVWNYAMTRVFTWGDTSSRPATPFAIARSRGAGLRGQ